GAAGTAGERVTVADFDGDPLLDLAVANNGSSDVSVFRGDGHGAFTPVQTLAVGSRPFFITHADLNRDGVEDLAVAGGSRVSVLLGHGDGAFAPAGSYSVCCDARSVAAAGLRKGNVDRAGANFGSN